MGLEAAAPPSFERRLVSFARLFALQSGVQLEGGREIDAIDGVDLVKCL
jgi:hypothetical protein